MPDADLLCTKLSQGARDYAWVWMVHPSSRVRSELGLQLLTSACAVWRPRSVPGT